MTPELAVARLTAASAHFFPPHALPLGTKSLMLQGQLDLCGLLLSRPPFTPASAECVKGMHMRVACSCCVPLVVMLQGRALPCVWEREGNPLECWLPSMEGTSHLGHWERARRAPRGNPPCISLEICTAFQT